MNWRSWVSRVLAGVAMTVVVALVVFVGAPWLAEPPVKQQPLGLEEIVAEALAPPMAAEEGARVVGNLEDAQEEGGTTAPLVAVTDKGDEVAVVFRTGAMESPEEEATVVGDDLPVESQGEAGRDPSEGLPPILSREEITGAMEALETGPEEGASPLSHADDPSLQVPEAGERPDTLIEQAAEPLAPEPSGSSRIARLPEQVDQGREGEALHFEAALPPPSATREVQELLEALGYAPGPVDGIWGERTAGAWRNFALDAADRASEAEPARPRPESTGRVEVARSRQEGTAGPSVQDIPLPSGGTVDSEGTGAEQAGVTHRRAGLPPLEAHEPVVVPHTLRGVMGYRMPLVSRQGVPDQVVSGVLIPAHTTFVILKPGQWELLGLSEEEAALLMEASGEPALDEPEGRNGGNADRRRFRLFDLFRREAE